MTAEANYKVSREHGDAGFRIQFLFWLAVCNDGMSLPDELEDLDDQAWEEAFGEPMPAYLLDAGTEELAGALIDLRKFGFLARVDVPLPTSASANGYSTRGFGYFQMSWVYAETVDEVLQKALAARNRIVNKRLAELRKQPAKAAVL